MEKEVRNSTKKMLMYFIVFSITMLFAGFISAYIVSSMGQYWVHITPPRMFKVSNVLIVSASVTLYLANKVIVRGNVSLSKMLLYLTLAFGIGFAYTQYSGWKVLESWGSGWNNRPTEFGVATSWNNIENLLEGSAIYGEDYEIKKLDLDPEAGLFKSIKQIFKGGEPLIFDSENNELYGPEYPVFDKEPITNKVKKLTNTSNAYLFVLMIIHVLHLALGLIYLVVNLMRIQKGIINTEDNVQIHTMGIYWHFLGGLWLVLFFILFSV